MRVYVSDPTTDESVLLDPGAAHHYHCPGCYSQVRSLEADGWCPRCNGLDDSADVRAANRRAGLAAREAQQRRGRLSFLEEWHR